LKQKSLTDVDRRFSAVEHPPALLEGGGVEPAELGELVRQASVPDRDGLRFIPARSFFGQTYTSLWSESEASRSPVRFNRADRR